MQIKTTNGEGTVLFSRILDNDKTFNATINHLMQQPSGEAFTTVVTNNGHDLTFRSAELNVADLVRKVEGVVIRKKD